MSTPTKPTVLIVGAGEFGSGTAVSLLQSGNYSSVTVIDRATTLPAKDAASCDVNKVVRFDYSDPDYSRLARESIEEWRKPEWNGIWFESGVVVSGTELDTVDGKFARAAMANVEAHGTPVTRLNSPEDFEKALSPPATTSVPVAKFPASARGYKNPHGGWAHAEAAVAKLHKDLLALGGKLVGGAAMKDLLYSSDKKDVVGVSCEDGRNFFADRVVVATGSWTPSVLKGLMPAELVVPTGQAIAAIQLSPELQDKYRHIPVVMRFDGAGFYSFPPNQDGLLKFALHGAGFLSASGVPRTTLDPVADKETKEKSLTWIPRESLVKLRHILGLTYPELAALPFTFTRMCWYSDTVDGDWVIDYHPEYPSLLIACGGAGHAFKFLPIMGSLIHARLENRLSSHLSTKWSLSRAVGKIDPARVEMVRKPLKVEELARVRELGDVAPSSKL
ncbi:hypothetical protein MNV49_000359 [Pseudohyphozyma bogoriensis]|nr:hypothetical protein MNV49_000359 [Pseudohyphozyma bogoriensis]